MGEIFEASNGVGIGALGAISLFHSCLECTGGEGYGEWVEEYIAEVTLSRSSQVFDTRRLVAGVEASICVFGYFGGGA